MNIIPIFVFDGPKRPGFKRDKQIAKGETPYIRQFRELIRHFGFAHHTAPGEAEAECAFLQKCGYVDAVISEDVDTIMFGCGRMLRDVRKEKLEGSTKRKSTTHVLLYNLEKLANETGLTTQGMIFIALTSGGDYDSKGIKNFGMKRAIAAAKAGYGEKLFQACKNGEDVLQSWRDSLNHEIRTNESKIFTRKASNIIVPEDFPNLEILQYYIQPTISCSPPTEPLVFKELNLVGLQGFAERELNWKDPRMLIKHLAGPLLSMWLLNYESDVSSFFKICSGKKSHRKSKNTDNVPEYQVE